jgi:hypothetical protein
MLVYDNDRRPVQLEPELARGGEATIHRVRGQPDLVAKVYTKPRAGYDHKLLWMRANPPSDPSRGIGHASIAWPRDVLRDVNGRFVGFTMPYVQGAVPILDVLSPRVRAQVMPGFDRRYLHRAARNLALAIGALHGRGYVVGDLNQSNVLVTPTALVTLIDTDSFQVQEARPAQIVVYPCPVGKPDYTPPELQAQAFADLIRLPEHDRFGLGVLVFQLLMEGSHPFRGAWRLAGDPPTLEEKIARGLYPYAQPALPEVAPPPGAPGLALLYPPLAELFDVCFRIGHDSPRRRPTPEAWAEALTAAEAALVTCPRGHLHADHLKACPVCGARHTRPVARPVAPAPRPAPVPVPVAATVGGTAVARHGPAMPNVGAVLARPFQAAGRAVDGALISVRRTLVRSFMGLAMFVAQRVAMRVGLAPARPLVPVAPTGLRIVRRTVGLALVAGALGAAGAFVLSGAWLLTGAAARGTTPGGLALAAGGLALAATALFRWLGEAMDVGLTANVLRGALARALAAGGGWVAAWCAGALVLVVLPRVPWSSALVGPMAVGHGPDLTAWIAGWLLYGAVGGALGAPVRSARRRWASVGLIFGALGWLAVQVLGGLV